VSDAAAPANARIGNMLDSLNKSNSPLKNVAANADQAPAKAKVGSLLSSLISANKPLQPAATAAKPARGPKNATGTGAGALLDSLIGTRKQELVNAAPKLKRRDPKAAAQAWERPVNPEPVTALGMLEELGKSKGPSPNTKSPKAKAKAKAKAGASQQVDGEAETATKAPKKAKALAAKKKFAQTPVAATASMSMGSPGLSVRDAFQKVAEQRALGFSTPQQAPAPLRPPGRNASQILDSLPQNLPAAAAMGEGLTAASAGGEVDVESGAGAIDTAGLSEGELRVLRHEENMRRKRLKMEEEQWQGASWRDQRRVQLDQRASNANRQQGQNNGWGGPQQRQGSYGQHAAYGNRQEATETSAFVGETPAQMKKRILAELVRKGGYAQSSASGAAVEVVIPKAAATVIKTITMPAKGMTIRELASALSMRLIDIHEKLSLTDEGMGGGGTKADKKNKKKKKSARYRTEEEVASAAESDMLVDADTAELIALEAGVDVKREKAELSDKHRDRSVNGDIEHTVSIRDPIVCVMGHVDHGKTTLLDTLRKASVADGEAGGITQRLSAFRVHNAGGGGRQVVFLDTPGHAAFSDMRSHGVSATDMVVLVVAIDDGVKTQTKEALKTAKDAGCTIIVALNKCDKITDLQLRKEARARVLAQLVAEGLVAEDYGGDTMVVETAAQTGFGLEALLEGIGLQADMMELTAASEGQCEAVVLDAAMEKGKGVVADVLVRWGSLSVGDNIIVDTMYGKVKAMEDDTGKPIQTAGPSTPVRILGLRTVPTAGQEMLSVDSEGRARSISERRQKVHDMRLLRRQQTSPGNAVSNGAVPVLDLVLKADGVGSLEALDQVCRTIGKRTREVELNIVHQSVGDINKRDIETASSSDAVVLGFNVNVADGGTRALAKELDVTTQSDNIIYRLEEKLVEAMQNLLPKERKESIEGTADVTTVFELNDKKGTKVAGMVVQTGSMRTSAKANSPLCFTVTRPSAAKEHADILRRIQRDPSLADPAVPDSPHVGFNMDVNCDAAKGIIYRESQVSSETVVLKRFKDVVLVVESGSDCGFVLNKFQGWEVGDVVHCYKVAMSPKELVLDAP